MQSLRRSTTLISGVRILSRSHTCTKKPVVCPFQHQQRFFGSSTRLRNRGFAFPTEQREPASEETSVIKEEDDISTKEWSEERYHEWVARKLTKNVKFIKTRNPAVDWHPAYLRDMCRCPRCRDPSSTQKTFQTTDIPSNIEGTALQFEEGGDEDGNVTITWENDIPGFGPDHITTFSAGFLHMHLTQMRLAEARFEPKEYRLWSKKRITKELTSIDYEEYMKDDEVLYRALFFLNLHGILLLKGVPETETAVEDIALRMGPLRDSLYGRTWDVKSVPEAKNVAYTAQNLGLHMDLLYMANPPGFQLLHCLKNTCEGGESLFSDTFHALKYLEAKHYKELSTSRIAYQYKNAGEHYYHEHPVIEREPYFTESSRGRETFAIKHVNYSPPFQADHIYTAAAQTNHFPRVLDSLRKFARTLEDPNAVFEYKMQEGECVIFNNRRVLHGRKQFDAEGGERWLKGAYVDTDVFKSRLRVLNEKYEAKGLEIMEGFVEADNGFLPKKVKEPKPIMYGSPFKKTRPQKRTSREQKRLIEEMESAAE